MLAFVKWIAVGALASIAASCAPVTARAPVAKTVPANRAYTVRLAEALDATMGPSQNLVASPVGLQRLLAMLVLGAAPGTAARISRVALPPANHPAAAVRDVSAFGKALQRNPGVTLRDALWLDDEYTTAPAVKQSLSALFAAPVYRVDFRKRAAFAAIDRWVARATHGLFRAIEIPHATTFVGIDAFTYHGTWTHPFNRRATSPALFHGLRKTVRIPMMHALFAVRYVRGGKISYALLPFTDGNTMLIALPRGDAAVPALRALLAASRRVITSPAVQVEVALPRFDVRSHLDLVRALEEMGLHSFFTNADFSPLFGSRVPLSDIYQDGRLTVDERGARTAVVSVVLAKQAPIGMPSFDVNHPFAYAILDARGDVLFWGRVLDLRSSRSRETVARATAARENGSETSVPRIHAAAMSS